MARDLISFEDALTTIAEVVRPHGRRRAVSLDYALGRVALEEIIATEHYPRFTSSSVDGFAIAREEDAAEGMMLTVSRRVAPGEPTPIGSRGFAIRVLTGAPIPDDTYAVAMQEDVDHDGEYLTLRQTHAHLENVRSQGSEIRPGNVLIPAGHRVNPGTLGLLAAQGIRQINVSDQARISIIANGDELVPATQMPALSQIRDCNGPMLEALAKECGVGEIDLHLMGDDQYRLTDRVLKCVTTSDMIVTVGGVSVGDKDYVPAMLEKAGEIHFRGLSIKPARPTMFGTIKGKPVICLPGNPASAFVGFHLFVERALQLLENESSAATWVNVRLRSAVSVDSRDQFLRCTFNGGDAIEDFEQLSFGLRSLAEAKCLVHIPGGARHNPGDLRSALFV